MSNELNIDSVKEFLSNLSVKDILSLVRDLEEQWGVEASAGAVVATAGVAGDASGAQSEAVEKSEFDIFLSSYPSSSKIKVIKKTKELVGGSLSQVKTLVDSVVNEDKPALLKSAVPKAEAEEIKKSFKEELDVVLELK